MDDERKVRSRPRTNEIRSVVVSVPVAPGERALLAAAAAAAALPVSCWIRRQALGVAAGISRPPEPVRPLAARHPPGRLLQSVTAHFTDEEFAAIVEQARACELSVGVWTRRLVLGCEPIAHRPAVRSAIAAVHRAGGILLQLIHPAGGGAALTPDQMRAVADLRDEIRALRDALLRADAAGASDPAG
jgi:hypothetical protein